MHETEPDMRRSLRARRLTSIEASEQNGSADEMRRQMEAAKQRMQKYHALYGQVSAGGSADPVNRNEER